ncbi:hypothetical protein BJX76DRAFT_324677 [Aspergillus varians]
MGLYSLMNPGNDYSFYTTSVVQINQPLTIGHHSQPSSIPAPKASSTKQICVKVAHSFILGPLIPTCRPYHGQPYVFCHLPDRASTLSRLSMGGTCFFTSESFFESNQPSSQATIFTTSITKMTMMQIMIAMAIVCGRTVLKKQVIIQVKTDQAVEKKMLIVDQMVARKQKRESLSSEQSSAVPSIRQVGIGVHSTMVVECYKSGRV